MTPAAIRRPASRASKGQMLLPFLFVLPAFILMTVFVIQVAQLSTEKIRQQFALDVASSAEMEQYADLLNRLAYINGVFPQRIFQGGMDSYGQGNLAYPSLVAPMDEGSDTWPIEFGGVRAYANVPDPPENFGILHMHPPGSAPVTLAEANRVAYDYISVYQWLGDVAAAQEVVFNNTVNNKHFLFKSALQYNLHNDGASPNCQNFSDLCGQLATQGFTNIHVTQHYLAGFKHCPILTMVAGQKYVGEMGGAFNFQGSGLWQLSTVPQGDLSQLKQGFLVQNRWKPPKNYFGIDLDAAYSPYVQSFVSTDGGKVWPDTTPKYSSRLFPAERTRYAADGSGGGD